MLLIAYERICMLMIIDFDKNMFNKKKNKKKNLLLLFSSLLIMKEDNPKSKDTALINLIHHLRKEVFQIIFDCALVWYLPMKIRKILIVFIDHERRSTHTHTCMKTNHQTSIDLIMFLFILPFYDNDHLLKNKCLETRHMQL